MAGLLLLAGALMTGCSKTESLFLDDEGQTAQDEVLADATDQDILTLADQYDDMLDNMNLKSGDAELLSDTCPVVTHYFSGDTMFVSVDFGTGCTDKNGDVRSGKIVIKRIGKYREPGFVKIIELENYHVNGNRIMGIHIVRNIIWA